MSAYRNTARRDRHRRIIRAQAKPCHICGGEIDYSLPYLDPGEFVIDHVVPLSRGGSDSLENLAASHRACNRAKSDRPLVPAPRVPVEASDIW